MVVSPARLLCDYGSGARVLCYRGLGLGGAARRARPLSPELQGGRSFIMSLHSDGSPGSCWCRVGLPAGAIPR